MAAWVIMCDGDFDQIVESTGERTREVRDLRAMGFEVTTKKFPSAAEAERWAEHKQGWNV